MKGDFHVRFCENAEVKLLCVTQLAVMPVDISLSKLSCQTELSFVNLQSEKTERNST